MLHVTHPLARHPGRRASCRALIAPTLAVLIASLGACASSHPVQPDGALPDAGPGDGALTDAAATDAGAPDGAVGDAALPDAAAGDAGAGPCDPAAPGTGLAVLSEPTFSVRVSASTPVFRTLTDSGKQHYPDSAVSVRDTGAGWEVYLASGRESYRLSGPSPTEMVLDPAAPVLAPTGDVQDPHQGYAGVTSVLECGGALTAFFHAEYHALPVTPWAECPVPYHASMGRAVSVDGGATFAHDDPAWFLSASAAATYSAGKCAYGAGGGSVFDPGGPYLYLYYFDWDAPNGIYVARTCREGCGAPGTWRKLDDGDFSGEAAATGFLQPAGAATPVIPTSGGSFDAFPVVSWNSYLDAYLMVVATESGFALRASADGVSWGPRIALLQHLDAADDLIPVYYPTVVDAVTWSRDVTGRQLKLIHATVSDDLGRRASHRAFVADVELTLAGDAPTATYDRRTLLRYANPADPVDHWCTTNPSTGYPLEGTLGLVAAGSLPGTRPLYDCVLGGTDHLISLRSDCEGGVSLGILGYAWTTPGAGRHAIHRCWYTTPEATTDHLVSVDPACEGATAEGALGYVE